MSVVLHTAGRQMVDFGPSATGLTPVFLVYKDLDTLADIAVQPEIFEIGFGTYGFDVVFPLPGSPTTTSLLLRVAAGVMSIPLVVTPHARNTNSGPIRELVDLGDGMAGLAPAFTVYRDLVTQEDLIPHPEILEIGFGAYYFTYAFPVEGFAAATTIDYVIEPGPAPAVPPLPTAVIILTARAGDAQVALSWIRSADAFAAGVSSYHITVSPADAGPFDQAGTTLMVTGLSPGTEYTFTVTAVGTAGSGSATSVLSTPLGTTPGPVVDLFAAPGDSLVDLGWEPPVNAAESGVTGYHIEVNPPDAGPFNQPDLTLEVTGLTNGVLYTFTVNAVAALSDGPPESIDATPEAPPLSIFWVRVRGTAATPWGSPSDAITNNLWAGLAYLNFNTFHDDIYLALGTTPAEDGHGALSISLFNQGGDIWHTPAGAVPDGIWADACTNFNQDTGLGGDIAIMVGTTLAGVGCIARSTDFGEHWSLVTAPGGSSGFNACCFAPGSIGRFIIVGRNGFMANSTTSAGTAFVGASISGFHYYDVAYSTAFAHVTACAQGNSDLFGTIATLSSIAGGWSNGFAPPTSPLSTRWSSIVNANLAFEPFLLMIGPRNSASFSEATNDGSGGFNEPFAMGDHSYSSVTYNAFHQLAIATGGDGHDAVVSNGAGSWTEYDDPYNLRHVASNFSDTIAIGGFDPDSGEPVVGIYQFSV